MRLVAERLPGAELPFASPLPSVPERPASPAELPDDPVSGHLGHRKRLRERFLERGGDALADYELLEMLLGMAQPRIDTKPLAKALIARFGSFAAAIATPINELRGMEGLDDVGIAALKAVQTAAQRLARAEIRDRPVLGSFEQVIDYLNITLARERTERFLVLHLDARNRLLGEDMQAAGTVNHTPVYPREVVKRALEVGAVAILLVHNHPSGDATPSRADIEMTREVRAAADALGIVLHDHIIIGNGRHMSFRREGLL